MGTTTAKTSAIGKVLPPTTALRQPITMAGSSPNPHMEASTWENSLHRHGTSPQLSWTCSHALSIRISWCGASI